VRLRLPAGTPGKQVSHGSKGPSEKTDSPSGPFYGLDGPETLFSRKGAFVCSILLSNAWFDRKQLIQDFSHDWNLQLIQEGRAEPVPDKDQACPTGTFRLPDDDSLVLSIGNLAASILLFPVPIPNQEADIHAARNYLWPGAAESAKTHKAHVLIIVSGQDSSLIEQGRLFVNITASCCRQVNVTGVCTNGVVFQPALYRELALRTPENRLPVLNWIWFGLYQAKEGVSGYTYGLELFGKEEIEILNANIRPNELRRFLVDTASYVLEKDATLKAGETIGFQESSRFAITRSRGRVLPGMTLKIAYEPSCAAAGSRPEKEVP